MWCRPYCIHVWIKIAINRLFFSIFSSTRTELVFLRGLNSISSGQSHIIVDSTLQAINPMVSTWETDKPWVFTFRHPSSGKQMVWRFYVTRPSDLQYLTMPNVPTVPTMLYIHIYIYKYAIPYHTIPKKRRSWTTSTCPVRRGARSMDVWKWDVRPKHPKKLKLRTSPLSWSFKVATNNRSGWFKWWASGWWLVKVCLFLGKKNIETDFLYHVGLICNKPPIYNIYV